MIEYQFLTMEKKSMHVQIERLKKDKNDAIYYQRKLRRKGKDVLAYKMQKKIDQILLYLMQKM